MVRALRLRIALSLSARVPLPFVDAPFVRRRREARHGSALFVGHAFGEGFRTD